MCATIRHFRLLFLVILAVGGLTAGRLSRGDESPSRPPAGDSIQLPSGTVIKLTSLEAHPNWTGAFPLGHSFYADKYAEGKLHGMYARYKGRLDGASVILHENGNLKILAYFPGGQQQGACRVWDEDKNMLIYARFKDGKKDGVTCFFKDNVPWLIQEWSAGALQNETLVARKGSNFVAVDDAQQLAQAQAKLSAIEKERSDAETELKSTVRSWYVDEKQRIDAEKEKDVRPGAFARLKVAEQRERQEKDARVAAAHTHLWGQDRVGRVASADERFASGDLKAEKKNANAMAKDATKNLRAMDAALSGESREMYAFALRSLAAVTIEKAPVETKAAAETKAPVETKAADRQRTFIVTYKAGKKKGQIHTEEIRAASAEEAKEKVREQHPHAAFKTIEEK